MTAMNQHRVAILGAGWAATHIAQAFCSLGIEIAYVWNPRLPRAEQLIAAQGLRDARSTTRYSDVYEDPSVDIVAIATPHHVHTEQLLAAAEHRKHIVVDKPVTLRPDELRLVVLAVRRAGVQSTTTFVHRAGLYQQAIKRCVLDGLVGRPFYTEVDYVGYLSPQLLTERPWLRTSTAAGSVMIGNGIHGVDTARWLASTDTGMEEAKVVEVQAMSHQVRQETDYPDFTVALLRFADGSLSKVTGHYSGRGFNIPPVTIYGTEGTIRGDEIWSERLPEPRGWLKLTAPHPSVQGAASRYTGYIQTFMEALDAGRTPPCSIESTVNTHEACFAADLSARTGKPVRLPLQSW